MTGGATTLVITNDFPPVIGGIEAFVAQLCDHLDTRVVVLTRRLDGAAEHDRGLPYPVVRRGRVLLPTPQVARVAEELLDRHRISRVLYGSAAPLGLLAPRLARRGVRQVALTHGHEVWWAALPGTRRLLHRVSEHAQLTYISDYTARRLAPAVADPGRLRRLPPPVDLESFHPRPAPGPARPTVLAAGRLIRQKGFDRLVEAWSVVLDRWPGSDLPQLLIAGGGPQRARLQRLADRHGRGTVTFLGPIAHREMPALLHRAHIFALPVRTRLRGLNPEGLGLVFVEAAASGLPVVVGRSGGAPETVRPGETGQVVDSEQVDEIAEALLDLLLDLPRAARLGAAGRNHVADNFSAALVRRTLRELLDLPN